MYKESTQSRKVFAHITNKGDLCLETDVVEEKRMDPEETACLGRHGWIMSKPGNA